MEKHSVYLVYGNQPLELEEEADRILKSLVDPALYADSVFRYDADDLLGTDKARAASAISDIRNTCSMMPFFSDKIVLYIRDIHKIPSQRNPCERIEKSLKEINLVHVEDEEGAHWYDADTLPEKKDAHHHIVAFQLVRELQHFGGKEFYLNLLPDWQNRLIRRRKGRKQESLTIEEFLTSRIKGDLHFKLPENREPSSISEAAPLAKLLVEFLEDVPEHINFVFTAEIKKTTEINKEIFDLLKKKAKILKKTIAYDDFRPVPWVTSRAIEKGLTIHPVVADLLIEVAGADFATLDMELTKLSLYLGENREVSPETLLQIVSHSKKFSIFRVSNYLIERDLQGALEALEKLLHENVADAIGLFGLIAAQFRKALRVSWLLDVGISNREIISVLKLNPWLGEQLITKVRKFSRIELENIVVQIAHKDLQTKYSAKDAIIILENLCYQICSGNLRQRMPIKRQWVP